MADNLKKLATLGTVEKLAERTKQAFAGKVGSAVNGHLAALDASGNLTDSGKSAADFVGSVAAGEENGKIKVDGKDVTVCEIASDEEADAMLTDVFEDD